MQEIVFKVLMYVLQENFQSLMRLSAKARQTYKEMVNLMEHEAASLPAAVRGASGYPQLYAHMGHSRTPSACSGISYASLLSEPISENYPHSEPETDSRGYEIVRDKLDESVRDDVVGKLRTSEKSGFSSPDDQILSDREDIDSCASTNTEPDNVDFEEDMEGELDEDATARLTAELTEAEELDTPGCLPTIEVILDNVDILSQHSSKTAITTITNNQQNVTENGIPTSVTPIPQCTTPDNRSTPLPSNENMVDKERIESWVAETQQQLEKCPSSTTASSATTPKTETPGFIQNVSGQTTEENTSTTILVMDSKTPSKNNSAVL